MKNVKIVLSTLLSVMLFTSIGYSAEIKSISEKETASINAFRDQIAYTFSDVPFESNLDVFVRFTVSNGKSLVINEVSSVDMEFAKVVKSKLEKSRINMLSALDGTYLIKIRFLKEGDSKSDISDYDVLRSLFREYLVSVASYEQGSVKVRFAVKDGAIVLKKAEGANENLVKSVETALADNKIAVPSGINGNYEVKITF